MYIHLIKSYSKDTHTHTHIQCVCIYMHVCLIILINLLSKSSSNRVIRFFSSKFLRISDIRVLPVIRMGTSKAVSASQCFHQLTVGHKDIIAATVNWRSVLFFVFLLMLLFISYAEREKEAFNTVVLTPNF